MPSPSHADLLTLGLVGQSKWVDTSKRAWRVRAHSNPLNDGTAHATPVSPAAFSLLLPGLFGTPADRGIAIDWCDVGCGYGGLLASLSVAFPDVRMIGLEIRFKVAEFCAKRVEELRKAEGEGAWRNVAFVQTNAMRCIPVLFPRASLRKMFFCYPDPHFKKRKHRQRIISDQLLAEYAYVLAPGGVAYIVTDVEELFEWMDERFGRFPLFRRRTEEEVRADPVVGFVRDLTDEAARVVKKEGGKFDASFVRV